MATKTIDVALASIHNVGTRSVAPKGALTARIVRAVDDEQTFEAESLYLHLNLEEPLHPSGATRIKPGESLTYNVTKRLTVSHFEQETEGHLNQMLVFNQGLEEHIAFLNEDLPYQGSFNRKVRFDEINGFQTIECDYHAFTQDVDAKILVTYTVNLVSSSG
ncbi:hypothetical protein ACNF49_38765 [Actinomadura sp. ATCC 39365]|uniref:hypothetical protein n=1 Tax=Nonomuraea sp. NPDC005692 TaxID=3157168 RepID=UPI0033CAE291